MQLFSCNGLSKRYYEKLLFENIAFGVSQSERVGIIGRNGVGKSSLLRIIAGLDEPDEGILSVAKDARFEYLSQLPVFEPGATALGTVLASARIPGEAWDVEQKAIRTLHELGIDAPHDRIDEMSGGQQKRVAIARSILTEPDLLILDEPTNHLDAESVQWLQDEIMWANASLLLVTHDRYFLDAVCTRIVELDQSRMFSFPGGYEKYLEQKETMLAIDDATAAHQRNKLRNELAWLGKGAKARRTKQKSRIDWIRDMQDVPEKTKQREIEIELGNKFLGGKIIEAVDISSGTLFQRFTYHAAPGDRIGIIGPNGAGKSTLLSMLAGERQPSSGYVQVGDTVTLGMFRQNITDFSENDTVLANVRAVAEYIDTGVGRDRYLTAKELCDRFGFSSKQQHAMVHTLSGGERRRLGLLRMVMANPNVMFLDEPTNDFDIQTLSALEEYLQFFKGVLIIVSHDRFFLDRCVTTLWVFEQGTIKEYPGNYSAYLERREQQKGQSVSSAQTKATPQPAGPAKPVTVSSQKKLSFKQTQELAALEQHIPELENQQRRLEELLNGVLAEPKEIIQASTELAAVISQLEQSIERWVELSAMVEL
jgi:ABC transport system ATP-binding/permease protein